MCRTYDVFLDQSTDTTTICTSLSFTPSLYQESIGDLEDENFGFIKIGAFFGLLSCLLGAVGATLSTTGACFRPNYSSILKCHGFAMLAAFFSLIATLQKNGFSDACNYRFREMGSTSFSTFLCRERGGAKLATGAAFMIVGGLLHLVIAVAFFVCQFGTKTQRSNASGADEEVPVHEDGDTPRTKRLQNKWGALSLF